MKATVLKKDKRFESRVDRSLNIQTFGESNDFLQQVIEIVDASGTGKACVGVYAKFISGRGFSDNEFYKMVINNLSQTNDYILDQISKDFAQFGGFSIHINYNANFKITEIFHQPFEHVRFMKLDDKGSFNKVAIHPDWGKRFTQVRKWKKEDVQYINLFNPDPEIIQEQVDAVGGWQNYQGQVYYFSSAGEKTYPLPIFDAVLTDMNTEEGISNVNNRNARNNFLTAGMLIDKVADNNSAGDDGKIDTTDTEKALKEFQGDEQACKIMYVQIETDDEKPEFVSFKGTNYDREFTVTNTTIQANIGKSFNQPPILRAETVAAGFSSRMMVDAYDYYNSVTENERLNVERVFTAIFKNWLNPIVNDAAIIPLSYQVKLTLAERLGEKGFEQLISIIDNTVYSSDQKRSMARRMFDLTDEELNDIIPTAA